MEVSNLRNRILTNQKPEQVVRNCQWNFMVRDDTHKKSMKIVQFSRPPNPPYHLCPKLFHPLTLDVHFQTKLPYHQTITSQVIEDMIHGWLLCYQQRNYRIIHHLQWLLLTLPRMGQWPGYLRWLWLESHRLPYSLHAPYPLAHKQCSSIIKDAFTVWCQCQKDLLSIIY